MKKIGIIIRDTPYLKLLSPIISILILRQLEFYSKNGKLPFLLYFYLYDAPRGEKEYLRATKKNVSMAHPGIFGVNGDSSNPNVISCFVNDRMLKKYLDSDGISSVVSVEIGLWNKGIKQKKHSLLYLTDSLWTNRAFNGIDFVYPATSFLNSKHRVFNNISNSNFNCYGSPIFDQIDQTKCGNAILFLMPNIRKENIPKSFGSEDKFRDIVEKTANAGKILFKIRKKQWVPKWLGEYGPIFEDSGKMYPSTIMNLLGRTNRTVMFYSSGVFESIFASNYTVNIKLPLKTWSWNQRMLKSYFESSVYNYPGVITSKSMGEFKTENLCVSSIDTEKRKMWIHDHMGSEFDNYDHRSSEKIANNVVKYC